MNVNSLAHTKWEYKYHIVFAPKYRRKVNVCARLFISIWITSFDFMWLANQHNYITGGFLL